MTPSDPPAGSPESARAVAARLASLAGHLLRLEDRADPAAAAAAATDCAEIARAAAAGPAPVARLAAALAAVTADVRDGRAGHGAALIDALIGAADALGTGVGSGAAHPDDGACEAARAALLSAAAAAVPAPPPSAPVSGWPGPGTAVSPDLLAQFTIESLDSLHEAETALLDLEGRTDHADAVNRLFRAVHSLKGTAGYVGLDQIRTLSHKLENVLALVRSGRLPLADEVSEVVFHGVDHLKGMVAALTPTGEVARDLVEFTAVLDVLCAGAAPDSERGTGLDPAAVFRGAANQYLDGLTDGLNSVAAGDCSDATLGLLRRSATSLKSSAAFVGRADVGPPADELLAILARLADARDRLAATVLSRDLVPPAPGPTTPAPPAPVPRAAPRPAPRTAPAAETPPHPPARPAPVEPASGARPAAAGKTMRVDQRKLDEYVNLAGELVIARNSLVHAHRLFQTDRSAPRALKDAVDKVCRIVGDLQSNAMGMRMVPVGTVFQRFPRLVRDVAKTLGKQIELELFGEDTELDKQVAEALSDPLVHLVRNAADHGIEAPDTRRAASKPEVGTITLRAGREGNAIVIDIQDDGGGIDAERLRAKAVSTGVVTADQAAAMSRDQALQLVFAAGLSTAKVVTDLSGRGVGMDVVKNNIAALGGAVSIRSEPGQGTTIRLALPLTLAVTTAVLVEAGGMTFGIPIDVVQETLKVPAGGFHQLRGVRAVSLRGDIIPVKVLGDLIGLAPAAGFGAERSETSDRVPVVVLNVAGARFGVMVDALKGQQEIVLKPVPPQLGHIDGIGGATIMGDGGIVLVLDPSGLYRRAQTAGDENPPAPKPQTPKDENAAGRLVKA